ncbi:FMN-binding protein [Nocardioides stalactiti]|uniref:FMN-binding protein n=1 Tax=Nocardioides stalactiti TaxID=2755356 RepID=UPI0016016385|nr:FMN-binding protein [Nocardioides stalactiti]
MKRILIWLVSTVAALVLLLNYRTSTMGPAALAHPGEYVAGTTGAGPGTGTATGSVIDTKYGPVQVEVTVEHGVIAGARVLKYPTGSSKDEEINSYALPILLNRTVGEDAVQPQVDMVSGATYTSEAYRDSLQSALDEAMR